GLAVFLLRILKGDNAILALPLAASLSATVAAAALCLILFLRLHAKMKMDRGMQRLLQRRRHLQTGAVGADLSRPSPIYRPLQPMMEARLVVPASNGHDTLMPL